MEVFESLRKAWNSELTWMYSKSRDVPYSSLRRFQIAGALSLTVMTLMSSSDLSSASRASALRAFHEMTDAESSSSIDADSDSDSELSSGLGLGSFPRTMLRHL